MDVNHSDPSAGIARSTEQGSRVSAPSSALVHHSYPCRRCGYELKGLPVDGACPECRFSIAQSLEGDLLRTAPVEYLRRLKSGLRFILNGILAQIILRVLTIGVAISAGASGVGSGILELIDNGLSVLVSAVLAFGYWRFTEPDAGYAGMEKTASPRKLIRTAVVIGFVVQLGAAVVPLIMRLVTATPGQTVMIVLAGLAGVAALVSLAAWAVQFFAMMRYVRWVAERVPDRAMVQQTRTYVWLLPVLTTVGAIVLMIGPLVALVLYWNMLDRLLTHIKRLLAQLETPGIG